MFSATRESERLLHRACHQHMKRTEPVAQIQNDYTLECAPNTEVKIPSPSLFTSLQDAPENRPESPSSLPSIPKCAVHLELLQVFHTLHNKVLGSGAINQTMGYTSKVKPTPSKVTEWYKGKWDKYVEFAVVRFLAWRDTTNRRIRLQTSASEEEKQNPKFGFLDPPVDVLMVWHAFMLNPELYRKHCQKEGIYQLGFNWQSIHETINNHQWTYGQEKRDVSFEDRFGIPYDLLRQFKDWPFAKFRKSDDQTFPGLNDFSFGVREIGDTNGKSKKYDQMVSRYAKMFHNIDIPLAKTLFRAVIRQQAFAEKMHKELWIRSPVVEGTIRRAIGRYEKFLELLKRHKGTMCVPTLDIDLVWHTHQLSGGERYVQAMESRVGYFVNHDDTIVKNKLDTGYDTTAELYRMHFGKEYRICGCWDCELLLSEMEKVIDLEVHEIDMKKIVENAERELLYHRAVESMRRQGQLLPLKNWVED